MRDEREYCGGWGWLMDVVACVKCVALGGGVCKLLWFVGCYEKLMSLYSSGVHFIVYSLTNLTVIKI